MIVRLEDGSTIELSSINAADMPMRFLVPAIRVLSQLSNTGLSSLPTGDTVLRRGDSLSYSYLAGCWRRSLRNGNWGRLSISERGLFRCALWLARARGKISNMRLMVHVLRIVLKLLESCRGRIQKAGRRRAMQMLGEYAKPGGVFSWAPRLREWLNDARYVRYLGVMEVNL